MNFFPISTFDERANEMSKRVYFKNGDTIWMGWREDGEWRDAHEPYRHPAMELRNRTPLEWAPALPEFTVPLPEEKHDAGVQLESIVDDESLPIQGAMWTHSPNHGAVFVKIAPDGMVSGYPRERGWKYLLVTPDVALVRDRLPELFRSGKISQAMTIDDVDIVGPGDPMFQLLAKWVKSDRSKIMTRVVWSKDPNDCNIVIEKYRASNITSFKGSAHVWNLDADDGSKIFCEMRCNSVVYRSLKTVDGSDIKRSEPLQLAS